jgi:hypothetical protein
MNTELLLHMQSEQKMLNNLAAMLRDAQDAIITEQRHYNVALDRIKRASTLVNNRIKENAQ